MGRWKDFQAKYEISGDLAKHPVATVIRDKLDRQAPAMRDRLTAEGELEAYIACMVDQALDEIQRLVRAGYQDNEAANEAVSGLVPDEREDDEDEDEDRDWEIEGAMADEAAALDKFLANRDE